MANATLFKYFFMVYLHIYFIRQGLTRPSKGGFDVALSLVYESACRLFGKGQMSLSLFRYNTNVAVVLSFCDAVGNLYNLVLLVPVSVPCEQLVSPTKPTACRVP